MQNLVKIQEELKNVPLQAVMSYVDGRNPMVPPYLALTELNRRKQIQQSAQAQQQPQTTVKDQVQQQAGIMALQNQRAQQGMENMQQNAGRVPQPGAVPMNAPVQGAPAQAPTVQAAEGGLMSARMSPAMFNRQNFAGGGIVAFARGDQVEDEELSEEAKRELEKIRARTESVKSGLGELTKLDNWNPLTSGIRAYKQFIADPINRFTSEPANIQAEKFRGNKPYSYQATPEDKANYKQEVALAKANDVSEAERLANFDAATALFEKERAAKTAVPPTVVAEEKPPVAKPPVADNKGLKAVVPPQKDIYDQEAERLEKLKERFGVKDQPMSESDRMIADLRQRIDAQRGQQGIEAIAAAMARGSKGKKTFEALSGFGEGYFETAGKQRSLNNEQDQAFANLQIAREKEDDARRRGDVKAVQEAVEKTRKAQIDAQNAESNRIQAMKPSQFKEQVDLYTRDPQLYAKMFPKENPLVVAAAKTYFEKAESGLDPNFVKQYPTVQDYLRAKGLSASGDVAAAPAPSTPPPAAIDALKKDPKLRKQFDDKYGPGASNRYLG
jgi:hypothetical protein